MSDDEKPLTVVIPDELLEKLPEEERAGVREEILDLFADFDPENPPGDVVEEIPAGTTHCPVCGTKLEVICRNREVPGQDPVDFYDCGPCDRGFMSPTVVQ